MKRKRAAIIIVVILLIALCAGLLYYYFKNRRDRNELFLYGNVDVREVDISFRVSGKVEKLLFQEGDVVSEGDLMATLNQSPYNAQVTQAKANLESTKTNFENAEKLLRRRQELIEAGGVSQETLDDAQTNRDALSANLQSAEAALAIALDNLSYTETFAPSDGILLTRIREPGSVVNEGEPVYTLSISSPIWIRAFIDEPHLGQIYYGMDVEVFTDTKGAPSYCGKIGFISPVAEFTPKTVQTTQLRTDLVYRLRIYVDNPNKELKQGMPVTVKIKLNGSREIDSKDEQESQ